MQNIKLVNMSKCFIEKQKKKAKKMNKNKNDLTNLVSLELPNL